MRESSSGQFTEPISHSRLRFLASYRSGPSSQSSATGGLFEQLLNIPISVPNTDQQPASNPINDLEDSVSRGSERSSESSAAAETTKDDDHEDDGDSSDSPATAAEAINIVPLPNPVEESSSTPSLEASELAAAPKEGGAGLDKEIELAGDATESGEDARLPVDTSRESTEQVVGSREESDETAEIELSTTDVSSESGLTARSVDPQTLRPEEESDAQTTPEKVGLKPIDAQPDTDGLNADSEDANEESKNLPASGESSKQNESDRRIWRETRRGKWYQTEQDDAGSKQANGAVEASSEQRSPPDSHGIAVRALGVSDGPSLAENSDSNHVPASAVDSAPNEASAEAVLSTAAPTTRASLPATSELANGSSAVANSGTASVNESLDAAATSTDVPAEDRSGKVALREAAGGRPAPSAGDVTRQDRVRLVQRIARSFSRLGPTGGEINLKLHPPQLGSLNVHVRLEGRSMTAKLVTESAAARDAILESLPVLRGRLSEQGFEVANFQVEVADDRSDSTLPGSNSDGQFAQQGGSGGTTHDHRDARVDYRRLAALERNRMDRVENQIALDRQQLWLDRNTGVDFHA